MTFEAARTEVERLQGKVRRHKLDRNDNDTESTAGKTASSCSSQKALLRNCLNKSRRLSSRLSKIRRGIARLKEATTRLVQTLIHDQGSIGDRFVRGLLPYDPTTLEEGLRHVVDRFYIDRDYKVIGDPSIERARIRAWNMAHRINESWSKDGFFKAVGTAFEEIRKQKALRKANKPYIPAAVDDPLTARTFFGAKTWSWGGRGIYKSLSRTGNALFGNQSNTEVRPEGTSGPVHGRAWALPQERIRERPLSEQEDLALYELRFAERMEDLRVKSKDL